MYASSALAVLALALAAFTGAAAQSSTSTVASSSASAPLATPSGLTPCILQCSTQAASSAGCSDVTDFSCLCPSMAFQTAALACLQANCTASELSAAMALQTQECSSVSGTNSSASGASSTVSNTASAASFAASSASSGTANPSSGTASPTTASSAAGKLTVNFGVLSGVALALAGAGLVL